MSDVMIQDVSTAAGQSLLAGARPLRVNQETGIVQIATPRGIVVNSMLRKDEWEELDRAVVEPARLTLRAVTDLRSRGLIKPLGGIGTMVAQYSTQAEMTAATVNMTGQSNNRDGQDFKLAGVPVPVVSKDFTVGARELDASRRMGDGLDVTGAAEASRVVAEALESLLINGAGGQLNGQALYGYTTQPNRNTDTASNYGGGDWGTVTNVVPTVSGMISAANLDAHYGPFMVYAATTQYNQAALAYFTDGSGQTPADRIKAMPQVAGFEMLPLLADGAILLIQMSRAVVEWAEALTLQVMEWTTGDGMVSMFKVMAVAAPIVKARYDGKSGIVHATGA